MNELHDPVPVKHVNGVALYGIEINSACIMRVAAGTTGECGGDSGHGGKTIIEIADDSGCDIECTILQTGHDGRGTGMRIALGGDCEMSCLLEALEFAAATIRREMLLKEGGRRALARAAAAVPTTPPGLPLSRGPRV